MDQEAEIFAKIGFAPARPERQREEHRDRKEAEQIGTALATGTKRMVLFRG